MGTPANLVRGAPATSLRWRRIVFLSLLVLIGLLLIVIGGTFAIASANTPSLSLTPIGSSRTQFDGHYLLATSDADMVGSAYGDGRLMQIEGAVDTLSLIALPLNNAEPEVIELPASNSVISYPQVIATSPEGDIIYVAEAAQQVDDTIAQLAPSNIPLGRAITMIDLRAGAGAATVQRIDVGLGATHVAISSDGAWLAVGLKEPGRQLAILPVAALDDPATFQYFSIDRENGQPIDQISSVFWHPSGEFLALGLSSEAIQFYRVERNATGNISITPHGAPISDGSTFSYGQFTKNGRFYLVSDINWDRYPRPLGNLINPASEMLAIRFDAGEQAEHVIVSRVPVGHGAEGYTISPQEDLIVTVNMGRTYLPGWLSFWPGAQINSLSLLRFDNQTGAMQVLGRPYAFEGVLPEAAQFDADGDSVAVAVYNDRNDPMGSGKLEFWNVIRTNGTAQLERTSTRVDVVRGPHTLALIP